MLTRQVAFDLIGRELGDSDRARHSQRVGELMVRLASLCDNDPSLWEIVGLCHDLDYFDTTGNRSQHGIVTADRLKTQLPEEAVTGIMAHDHRTGITSNSLLSKALRAADALDVLRQAVKGDQSRILTDAQVGLPEGDYRIELSTPIREQQTIWRLGVIEVPYVGALELSPPQGATMSGRVTGSASSDRVWIWLTRSPHHLSLHGLDEHVASIFSSNGSYELQVAPRTYEVAFVGGDGQIGQVVRWACQARSAGARGNHPLNPMRSGFKMKSTWGDLEVGQAVHAEGPALRPYAITAAREERQNLLSGVFTTVRSPTLPNTRVIRACVTPSHNACHTG